MPLKLFFAIRFCKKYFIYTMIKVMKATKNLLNLKKFDPKMVQVFLKSINFSLLPWLQMTFEMFSADSLGLRKV